MLGPVVQGQLGVPRPLFPTHCCLTTGSRARPGQPCLSIAAEGSSALRSPCQRLLFSVIYSLLLVALSPVELVLFFFLIPADVRQDLGVQTRPQGAILWFPEP